MKKLILVCFCFLALGVNAQFSVSSDNAYLHKTDVANLDALFMFNGISALTEITYTGTETVLEWQTFDGQFYSNSKTISPEDATGYILKINNVATYFVWVIDYKKYPITIASLTVVEADDKCENIKLIPTYTAPDLTYQDKNKVSHTLPRVFTLRYQNVAFANDAWGEPMAKSFTKTPPFTELVVNAPLCDTKYSLEADTYATEMNIAPQMAETSLYKAIAIEAHVKGTVSERTAKNELERSGADISGSGPLVVDFESRVNPISTNFYEWFIYNLKSPNSYIRYTDRDFRYTFTESGSYRVKLVAASSSCEYVDSLDIKVLESSLDVPNIFTPNGDGINDEFRVVFKSLKSYNCQVFNRWGRKVFSTDDPGKGWDGRINGQMAAPGAYYYVIQATGTDLDNEGNPIKYKLSGDINLLRGK